MHFHQLLRWVATRGYEAKPEQFGIRPRPVSSPNGGRGRGSVIIHCSADFLRPAAVTSFRFSSRPARLTRPL